MAGEEMNVVSISPNKQFAVVIENWHAPGTSDGEQIQQLRVLIINWKTRRVVNNLEDLDGVVSADWNKQSDGVIVFFHYGRLSGSRVLKLDNNDRALTFSEMIYPDLEKSLPPQANAEGGRGILSIVDGRRLVT